MLCTSVSCVPWCVNRAHVDALRAAEAAALRAAEAAAKATIAAQLLAAVADFCCARESMLIVQLAAHSGRGGRPGRMKRTHCCMCCSQWTPGRCMLESVARLECFRWPVDRKDALQDAARSRLCVCTCGSSHSRARCSPHAMTNRTESIKAPATRS
jgi:hypothetical protein